MKTSRRRAREFALQGLYQWQLAKGEPDAIARELAEARGFEKLDADYFRQLLHGTIASAPELEAALTPCLDRKYSHLSPIERAILLIAGYELVHQQEVPYRVVINEAVELAKTYGGTDGYKFVNGVLDKVAPRLRPGGGEIGNRK
jgi:N utilization substance protein B